jgi:hypothetical protein
MSSLPSTNKSWSPLRWAFSPLVSILHSFILILIFLFIFSCYFSYYSFLLLTQCFLFYSLLYFLVLHFFISLYFTNFILFLYHLFPLFFWSCAKIFSFILNHVLSFVKGIERIIMNKYMQVFKKKFISWIFQNNPYTFNRISWNLFLFSLVLIVRLGYQRRYISNFVSFKAPRFSNIGKKNVRTIKISEQRELQVL